MFVDLYRKEVNMKKIAILGSGGFAREVLCLIQDINKVSHEYVILGFIDNSLEKGTILNGYPVLGSDEEIISLNENLSLALAFGEPHLKKKVANKYSSPLFTFPNLVHPSVLIGSPDYLNMGKGCIICAGCILTSNIELGDFITLNLSCTVGHDTVIGSYSSFMPSCNISGDVIIKECVYGGTGVKIINQTEIGENTILGAGAVVSKSIPADCTAVGVPAKPVKFHK